MHRGAGCKRSARPDLWEPRGLNPGATRLRRVTAGKWRPDRWRDRTSAWRRERGSTRSNGRGLLECWRHTLVEGGQETMTDGSSRQSCGGAAPAYRGATCRASLALGRRCSIVSTGGPSAGDGTRCLRHYRPRSIRNGRASTARRTEPTSTPRVERGARSSRHRPIARWCDDQGPPRRRCPRPSARVRADRRTTSRHRACARLG